MPNHIKPAALLITVLVALGGFVAAAAAQSPVDLVRSAAAAGSSASLDHSRWTELLKTYVKPAPDGINLVDYASFKRSGHEALKSYIVQLQEVTPAKLSRPEQFAYFVNLYNAKTIDIVLDKYPVKSIKNISLGGSLFATFTGGPWKAKVLRVQGVDLSLDDIEHVILRPVFKDPRVHYAVNCASIGCPNLATEAYTGANLEPMLDAGARAYVNHPRGVTVTGGKLQVSSIYHWFKTDFGNTDEGVLAHLRQYAQPALAKRLQRVNAIDSHDYDWKLNDTRAEQS
ncbi:MAG: DUF547 domain-containing protein [Alphaproteobacteria bacterium]|nr:DUF547 domain-containing protein [Alphaproteobacteria bacterium]